LVTDCDAELLDAIDAGAHELIGREMTYLMQLLGRRYGEPSGMDRISRSDDRSDLKVSFDRLEVYCTLLPLRDEVGWADTARALLVLRPT
jgi:hypothetical protein